MTCTRHRGLVSPIPQPEFDEVAVDIEVVEAGRKVWNVNLTEDIEI